MENFNFDRRSMHGFSLVAVLVVLSIVTIIFRYGLLHLNRAKESDRHFLRSVELAQLKKFLKVKVSCSNFIEARNSCGTYVAIAGELPNAPAVEKFVERSKSFTIVGPFGIRAKCAACSSCQNRSNLLLEYALVNKQGDFLRRLLFGGMSDWSPIDPSGELLKCE